MDERIPEEILDMDGMRELEALLEPEVLQKLKEIHEQEDRLEPEEMQKEVFRALFKWSQAKRTPRTLVLPDDIHGQARCIRHLELQATSTEFPYEQRVRAFDQLQAITRTYLKIEIGTELIYSYCDGEFDRRAMGTDSGALS